MIPPVFLSLPVAARSIEMATRFSTFQTRMQVISPEVWGCKRNILFTVPPHLSTWHLLETEIRFREGFEQVSPASTRAIFAHGDEEPEACRRFANR